MGGISLSLSLSLSLFISHKQLAGSVPYLKKVRLGFLEIFA